MAEAGELLALLWAVVVLVYIKRTVSTARLGVTPHAMHGA